MTNFVVSFLARESTNKFIFMNEMSLQDPIHGGEEERGWSRGGRIRRQGAVCRGQKRKQEYDGLGRIEKVRTYVHNNSMCARDGREFCQKSLKEASKILLADDYLEVERPPVLPKMGRRYYLMHSMF